MRKKRNGKAKQNEKKTEGTNNEGTGQEIQKKGERATKRVSEEKNPQETGKIQLKRKDRKEKNDKRG